MEGYHEALYEYELFIYRNDKRNPQGATSALGFLQKLKIPGGNLYDII